MDLETFLEVGEPSIFNEPCLYIIQQSPQAGTNAYRCGTSGTQQYAHSDQVFGAENAQFRGLLGRCVMYKNYWLPNKGTIYAALRIKKQLVAKPGSRVETDAAGGAYSATGRANFTLVELREMEFHQALDEKGLRWQKDKRNELFQPKQSVFELVDALRSVRGEELYLFSANKIREDPKYDPEKAVVREITTETQVRQQPRRTVAVERKAPVITVRLNKETIEQLRSEEPIRYKTLVDLIKLVANLTEKPKATTVIPPPAPATIAVPAPAPPPADDDFDDDFDDADSDAPTVVTLPVAAIAALRDGGDDAAETAAAIAQLVTDLPRRPQTRAQTKAARQPRRSARIAGLRPT